MKKWWPPWTRQRDDGDRPEPKRAQDALDRLRAQREHVESLRRGYREEFIRNHFGENVEAIFRGGKP